MLPSSARDQELQGSKEPSPPTGDQELLAERSLHCLLLLLNSQSSRTSRGKGRVLLRLKTKTSKTPRGICHLLILHLRPTLIELLLHSSQFMRLLRIVCLVAFLFLGRKFITSIRTLVDKCFKLLNDSERRR
jgi:hypothetical protein